MGKGPKYRVAFKRRRQNKTNYHRRLKLIRSRRNRLVIRASNKHTTVQILKALPTGDKILSQAHSLQLNKLGWNQAPGNLPSAYLTGYLCGIRAKKAEIEDAILDIGIFVHTNRVKAAFKGILDAGVNIPYGENFFDEGLETRVNGSHIQEYAKMLSKEDKTKYKKIFNAVSKNNGDPLKIVEDFDKLKTKIDKGVMKDVTTTKKEISRPSTRW